MKLLDHTQALSLCLILVGLFSWGALPHSVVPPVLFSLLTLALLLFVRSEGKKPSSKSNNLSEDLNSTNGWPAIGTSFQELADSMPQIVWISNADGVPMYFNKRWYDFSGFSLSQLDQARRVQITHPDDRNKIASVWENCLASKTPFELQLRLWDYKSKFYRWFLTRTAPVLDQKGSVLYWIGTSTDIHQQKLLEIEQKKLTSIIGNSPDCILLATTGGKVIYVNPAGKTMLGIDGPLPNHVSTIFRHPHLYQDLIQPEMELQGTWSDEIELQNLEEGFEVITQCQTFLIRDDFTTETIAIALVARDISELKSAALERSGFLAREQAAIEASRMKSEFVANMSHEIRTPISGIMGLLSILKKTSLVEEQKTLVQNLEQSGRTLLDLINDILDLSKIEAGKVEFEIIDFDLRELIDGLRRSFVLDSTQKRIPLKLAIDDATPQFVSGDPTRVRRILMNLLSNAFKFSEHGEITITVYPIATKSEKHFIHFSVKDEGIGIAPDIQSRLFTPFTQADSSTTRKYGGTGLGLSISRHLVKEMKGQIGVKSELGKGSEFWFKIELGKASGQNLVPVAQELISLKGLRLLVAEDNIINQKIFRHILDDLEASYCLVSNGLEALEALKTERFNLIFMDCQMPFLDGYETSKRIRNGESGINYNSIPIIAVTANSFKQDKEKCLEAGMSDFLTKPMTDADLCRMAKLWLPQHTFEPLATPPHEAGIMSGLWSIFTETAPKSLAKIEESLGQEDWNQLKFELHKFKSSLLAVGLKECSSICQEMEKQLPTKDFESLEGLFVRLDDLVLKALTNCPT